MTLPGFTKTGTTIVGVRFEGGIVLGADTRATSGSIVADKNCAKIHYLAPNIYCCGAGTAADTEATTELIAGRLELHRMNTGGRMSRTVTAMTMLKQYLFRYQGHIGAALVLGGVDSVNGPQLYTVHPHGSVDRLPFVAMGSGSLAAMAVLETKWREGITREEAMEVVQEAIESGIWNDLGSGSNVDLVVISGQPGNPDIKVDYLRNHYCPPHRAPREMSYRPARGTTRVLKEQLKSLSSAVEVVSESTAAMDISQ